MTTDEKNLAEYKEADDDVRLHSTVLFGQLTVYLVATGGLIQVFTSRSGVHLLAVVGMLLSLVFWVIGERCYDWVTAARARAKAIEPSLGFSLYSSAPQPKIRHVKAINACRVAFGLGFFAWLAALLWRLFTK